MTNNDDAELEAACLRQEQARWRLYRKVEEQQQEPVDNRAANLGVEPANPS